MSKFDLSAMTKGVARAVKKHSPEILTGIGIAGMISTVVMAVKATPKALKHMEEERTYRLVHNTHDDDENYEGLVKVDDSGNGDYGHYRLPAKDVIKIAWKPYVPALITMTASIVCLIGASSVNSRRNTALATAYSLSETALREYKTKVIETIGEKKERTVRDAIAKDKVDSAPITTKEVIITTGGDTLCYEIQSGRYFKSDTESIRKAVNKLNHRLLTEMFISLNDFYYEIGLEPIKSGDDLGWHVDKGLIEIDFSTQMSGDDKPCLVIDYQVAPQYDYR